MSILRCQVPLCLENQTHSSFLQVKNQRSVPVLCPANIKKSALKSLISICSKHKVGFSKQNTKFSSSNIPKREVLQLQTAFRKTRNPDKHKI